MKNSTNLTTKKQAHTSPHNYPERGHWDIIYGYCGSGSDNLDDAIRYIASYSPHPHDKIKEICLREGQYSYGEDNGYCCINFLGHFEDEEGME